MKRIGLCVLILLALGGVAVATTMCADDDVVVIALDPQVAGTDYKYNAETFEWYTIFPYGTVFGLATCVDTNGTYAVAVDTLKSQDGSIATGGERTGQYCWCQLTHPALSRWVFRLAYASVDDCRRDCASHCGGYVRSNAGFRGGVFGSLGH